MQHAEDLKLISKSILWSFKVSKLQQFAYFLMPVYSIRNEPKHHME